MKILRKYLQNTRKNLNPGYRESALKTQEEGENNPVKTYVKVLSRQLTTKVTGTETDKMLHDIVIREAQVKTMMRRLHSAARTEGDRRPAPGRASRPLAGRHEPGTGALENILAVSLKAEHTLPMWPSKPICI